MILKTGVISAENSYLYSKIILNNFINIEIWLLVVFNNFNLKQYNSEINYMAEKITYNKNYNAISKTVIAVR